jgi:hypothetical protein
MLKSWSSANKLKYTRFPYPKPYGNPDAKGLFHRISQEIGNTKYLTFNWNTAAFGTWTDIDGRRIFTLFRSGALPVTYIPESDDLTLNADDLEKIRRAEDEYWDFFANQRDPYLNRAAQYTALHVIFSAVPVTAVRSEPLVAEKVYLARWHGLEGHVAAALKHMAGHAMAKSHPYAANTFGSEGVFIFDENSGCIVKGGRSDHFLTGNDAEHMRSVLEGSPDFDAIAMILTDPESVALELSQASIDLRRRDADLQSDIDSFNNKVDLCRFNQLAIDCSKATLSSRRAKLKVIEASLAAEASALHQRIASFKEATAHSRPLVDNLSAFGDCNLASKAVVEGVPPSDGAVYCTPGIVVSDDTADIIGTGGHNLDGRSVKVVGDASVAPGKVAIDAETGVVRLNPADVANGANAVRAFERDFRRFTNGDSAFQKAVVQRVEAALVHDVRAVQTFDALMLSRSGDAVSGNRGFVMPSAIHSPIVRSSAPQAIRLGEAAATELQALAQNSQSQVVIRSLADGPMEIALPGGRPPIAVRVSTRADLQSAVEAIVVQAGAPPNTATTIRLISADSTLSVDDMLAIKLSATGRPSAAAGGCGGRLPPGGTRGLIFDGAEGPWHKRLTVAFVSGRGNPLKRLMSTEADWARSTVEAVDIGGATGKSFVTALDIPSKIVERPGISAKFSALFSGRKATDADAIAFTSAVNRIKNGPQDVELWRQLELIRIEFQNSVVDGNDATLLWQIQDTADDFIVVERDETDVTESRRNG